MSQEQIQLVAKTQRLLHGPLKHVRAAALAAALLPLASVAVSPASAQGTCPSGGPVSGFVWNDVNNNGIQDAGEPGIAGAIVSQGTFSTTTDINGFYSFDLSSGTGCEISVQIPNGAAPSPANVGTDDAVDSDGVRDTVTGANSVATITVGLDGSIITDYDFGLFKPALTGPGTGTPGFWKNHPEAWTLDPIVIGGVTYTKDQALLLLDPSSSKDKTITMFSSLLSAKLNVAFGTDPSCVASTIVLADAWMVQYPVGSHVEASSYAWKVGEPLHRLMDNYNNGMLCAPHRD
jgi:hypothetical protein